MATLTIENTVEARDAVVCKLLILGTARNAMFALPRIVVSKIHSVNYNVTHPTNTVAC